MRRTCGRCISASSALREKTGDRQRVREAEWPSERGDKGRVGEVIGPERASESPTQPCDGGCAGQIGSPQRSATEQWTASTRECHGHRRAQIAAPAMRPAEEAAVSSACFGHVSRRLSRLFRRLPKSRSWSEGLRLLRRSSSSGALVLSGNGQQIEEENGTRWTDKALRDCNNLKKRWGKINNYDMEWEGRRTGEKWNAAVSVARFNRWR